MFEWLLVLPLYMRNCVFGDGVGYKDSLAMCSKAMSEVVGVLCLIYNDCDVLRN